MSGPGPVGTAPPSSSRAPVGYALAAVVVSLLAIGAAVVAVRHAGKAVYAVPPTAVAVGLASSVLAVAGAAGMRRRHELVHLLAGAELGLGAGRPRGDSTGTVTQGAATYAFTCRDGHLVEFREISRAEWCFAESK